MKIVLHWPIVGLAAGMFTVLSGCFVTTGRYGGAVDVYGVDYFEPSGYDYHGWGPAYHVAPPRGDRDDHDRPAHAENRQAQPAYRPASPSRPVPSIPHQSGQQQGGQHGAAGGQKAHDEKRPEQGGQH
jgi:hypothetical protein